MEDIIKGLRINVRLLQIDNCVFRKHLQEVLREVRVVTGVPGHGRHEKIGQLTVEGEIEAIVAKRLWWLEGERLSSRMDK